MDKTNTTTVIAQNIYTYNNKDQLSGITAGINGSTVNYGFTYNAFGNQTAVGVGSQNLITNTYETNNGNLTGSAYGNGDTVSYTYDSYDRVTGVRYEGDTSDRYTYSYDAEGKLSRVVDNENNKTYTYVYDILGRLTSKNCSDGTRVSYAFDKYNKGTKTNYRINGINRSVSYTYNENKDNVLDKTTFANSAQYQFVYNDYGQVTATNLTRGTLSWQNAYGFINPGSDRYSNIVSTIYFPNYGASGKRLRYRYDTKGNIAQIADGNGSSTFENADKVVTYTYDQLNQLKTEVNGYTGETVNYTYDSRGNILSKEITVNGVTDTVNYTYGDSNWKDKLTAYDGKTITYDQIGNPLTYDGWEFTWQKGRQLAGMSNTDTALAFTYNNDGIRTSKTVNGTTTEYYLDGSTILGQKTGTQTLLFHYDGNGTRVYMEIHDSATSTTQGYYYVYNQQGDVIALYDNTGAVVAEYTYDSWGKIASVTGNTTVGNLNPFRYRGYYYDNETELYYLKSRYYNPETCRMLNADGLLQTGTGILDKNMYAYCNNNPVNMSDLTGQYPTGLYGLFNVVRKRIFNLYLGGAPRSSVNYNTLDEATEAWKNEFKPKTKDTEFAAMLYEKTDKKTGKKTYTYGRTYNGGRKGVVDGVVLGYIGALNITSYTPDMKLVGMIHSHPAPTPGNHLDFASEMDKWLLNLPGINEVYTVSYNTCPGTPEIYKTSIPSEWDHNGRYN